MRRRILRSTSLIALAAVMLLGVPLAIVGTALLHQRADMTLERRADAAALRLARAQGRGVALRTISVTDLLPRGAALQVREGTRLTTFGTLPTGNVTRQTSGDGGPLTVTLVAPSSVRSDDVGTLWLIVALAGLGAVLAAAALALLQARRLAAPLEDLARRVERVGQPGYDGAAVARDLPEIDQVQRALNDADHRITGLVDRERQFTANASHQMRTPLTGLRMRLEELQALATTPEASREADAAITQVDRLVTTIEHLEVMGRHRDDQPPPIDIGSLVAEHVSAGGWAGQYARAGRPLQLEVPVDAEATVAPETVRQILDVLLDNALRHGAGGTDVRVTDGDGWVRLSVGDAGARPSASAAQEIFRRGVGRGTGIGLAVARDLALHAGGDLRLDGSPTTTFEAIFPGPLDTD